MSEDKWDTMARERAINDASLEKLYRQRVHRLVEFADHPRIAEELRATFCTRKSVASWKKVRKEESTRASEQAMSRRRRLESYACS